MPPPRSRSRVASGWWSGAVPASFGLAIAAFAVLLTLNQSDDPDGSPATVPAAVPSAAASPVPASSTPSPTPVPAGQPIEGWSEIAFRPPLQTSAAVANTDRRLYLAQTGTDTNNTITVWSAPLYANGTVGAVVEEQTLNTGENGFPNRYSAADMAISGDCLYALPATTTSDAVTEDQPIEWAPIDPATGALGPFTVSTGLLQARRAGAALHAVGNYLYAIAGFQVTESDDRRSVEFARVNADCTLGPWIETSGLTEPIADPRVVDLDGVLYVVGGSAGDSGAQPKSVVQRAWIAPDGSLSSWVANEGERLLNPRYEHDLVVLDEHLVAIGGLIHTTGESPGLQLSSVEITQVNADGSLAGWEEGAQLPEPRSRHRAIVTNGHVAILGGTVGRADPRIAHAERGLSTNQLLIPLDPPVERVDDAPPAIRAIICTPREPVVSEEVTCTAEVDGRTDTLDWAGTSLAPTIGPSVTTSYWEPITAVISLEACNTAGCDYADGRLVVDASLHFWQQHEPDHPASIPIEGGEFEVSLAAGTRDFAQDPEVTFRITGPDFEAELPAVQCARARHPWGASVCLKAIFDFPPNLVTEPTIFVVEASATLIDEPIGSEILVGVDPEADGAGGATIVFRSE